MKFLFVADSHLKVNIWSSRPDIQYDTFYSLDQVFMHAINNKIKAIVFGGDNLDNYVPSAEVISYLREMVSYAKENGIECFGIDGNHDKSRNGSWLTVCGITNISCNPQVGFIGSRYILLGVPYLTKDEVDERLPTILNPILPDHAKNWPKILVMHQLLDITCPMEGIYNLKASQIPKDIPLVLMGDYHVTTQVTNGKTVFAYPGSGAVTSLGEAEDKYFYEVDLSSGIKLNPVKLETRRFFQVEIRAEAEIKPLLKELAEEIDKALVPFEGNTNWLRSKISTPVVVLDYNTELEGVLQQVRAVTSNKAILIPRPMRAKVEEKKVLTTANFSELLGSFIDSKKDTEAFELAAELGATRDAVDVTTIIGKLYEKVGLVESE